MVCFLLTAAFFVCVFCFCFSWTPLHCLLCRWWKIRPIHHGGKWHPDIMFTYLLTRMVLWKFYYSYNNNMVPWNWFPVHAYFQGTNTQELGCWCFESLHRFAHCDLCVIGWFHLQPKVRTTKETAATWHHFVTTFQSQYFPPEQRDRIQRISKDLWQMQKQLTSWFVMTSTTVAWWINQPNLWINKI